jgi:hypothetical protein
LTPLQSALPAELTVFGRIDHLVKEDETEKIVDFSMFNQASQVDKLLVVLNSFNQISGQTPISETDLVAKYPDVFVTPVALYQ